MGLGILEPSQLVVQGTVQLFDHANAPQQGQTTIHLKHAKDGVTVLAPQPSDDPNDPLNRPAWQRNVSFLTLLFTTIFSTIHGPMLAPVTLELATEFNKSINDIAKLSSYMVLVLGISAYFYSIFARVYGKRLFFLIAVLVMMAADAWGAKANSYGSLLGARILSGFGQAAFEALGLGVVADIFFVHERGRRVALYVLLSSTGVTLGTPIVTQVAVNYGRKWAFGGLAISEGIMFILLFLFFFEPAYKREHVDALAHQDEDITLAQVHEKDARVGMIERTGPLHPDKKSYLQDLRPWCGRVSSYSLWSLTWRTAALNFHPIITWGAFVGLPLTWPVGIAFTSAATLSAPPYNFSATGNGNMFIAAWIGTTSCIIFGLTIDWFCMKLTKRNGNIYEPEFRFYYSFIGLIIYILGGVGWGWGSEAKVSWVGLAFFWAFVFGGGCLLNISIISYLIDAHRAYATESQVILFAFKNLFSYAMGYFFVPWWAQSGNKTIWGIICGVCAGIWLLVIPIYMYGKKLRAYWMRHPFFGITDMQG